MTVRAQSGCNWSFLLPKHTMGSLNKEKVIQRWLVDKLICISRCSSYTEIFSKRRKICSLCVKSLSHLSREPFPSYVWIDQPMSLIDPNALLCGTPQWQWFWSPKEHFKTRRGFSHPTNTENVSSPSISGHALFCWHLETAMHNVQTDE